MSTSVRSCVERPSHLLARCFLGALAIAAVGACSDYRICPAPDPARLAALPARLSETGLFSDLTSEVLAPGVRPYRPEFALWSDGAEKRRWIALPEGARIDTGDMNAWIFPEGTKVWKEFTRDGVRVETRLLQKVGPAEADWAAVSYVWTEAGDDAIATPDGAPDARGTAHDVPASSQCMGCHGGRKSRVLGFSAIQLSHEAASGEWSLASLADAGLLSAPPPVDFALPGDDTARAALGYIHANCGHCHNQDRPDADGPRCFNPENDLDFWLQVDRLSSVSVTPTYETAVGSVIDPGAPEDSKLLRLVSHRGEGKQMPPLATERVDDVAVSTLRAWIAGL